MTNAEVGSSWFFTAPLPGDSQRRGDPFGFQPIADGYAERLCPGLSGSTFDARWLVLLAWSLRESGRAWTKAGSGSPKSRAEQRERYKWLQPLEHLWVWSALQAADSDEAGRSARTGQLPGKRRLEKANKDNVTTAITDNDQLRRYRNVGPYGTYRALLRSSEITTGDGWDLTSEGKVLAEEVNLKFTFHNRPDRSRLDRDSLDRRYLETWFLNRWRDSGLFASGRSSKWLPSEHGDHTQIPGGKGRAILKKLLFSEGSDRARTLDAMRKAKNAESHADMCRAIEAELGATAAGGLSAFTRFADALFEAIRAIGEALGREPLSASELATKEEVLKAIERLAREAGNHDELARLKNGSGAGWCKDLAVAMSGSGSPEQRIATLIQHHLKHGSGQRLFAEDNGKFISERPVSGLRPYRFRLWSMARLAVQVGLADAELLGRLGDQQDDQEVNDDQ